MTFNDRQMLNDPAEYPDPSKFDPERFIASEGKQVQRDPYDMCFGFGRRYVQSEAPSHFILLTSWIPLAFVPEESWPTRPSLLCARWPLLSLTYRKQSRTVLLSIHLTSRPLVQLGKHITSEYKSDELTVCSFITVTNHHSSAPSSLAPRRLFLSSTRRINSCHDGGYSYVYFDHLSIS